MTKMTPVKGTGRKPGIEGGADIAGKRMPGRRVGEGYRRLFGLQRPSGVGARSPSRRDRCSAEGDPRQGETRQACGRSEGVAEIANHRTSELDGDPLNL